MWSVTNVRIQLKEKKIGKRRQRWADVHTCLYRSVVAVLYWETKSDEIKKIFFNLKYKPSLSIVNVNN